MLLLVAALAALAAFLGLGNNGSGCTAVSIAAAHIASTCPADAAGTASFAAITAGSLCNAHCLGSSTTVCFLSAHCLGSNCAATCLFSVYSFGGSVCAAASYTATFAGTFAIGTTADAGFATEAASFTAGTTASGYGSLG